jgi:hypothetical protein
VDCRFYNRKTQGLFRKIADRTGIFNPQPLDSKWTAQIGSGTADVGARPEQRPDGESRGGAIAGERESSIPSTIQRKENMGRESGARRAHLARERSRGRTRNGVELGMADGGGVVELQARCGVSGAPLTPRKGWMEAERCAGSAYIARRCIG